MISIIMMIVAIGVGHYFLKSGNVMEQIYTEARRNITAFNEIEALNNIQPIDMAQFENFGVLRVNFKEEYLRDGFDIYFRFPADMADNGIFGISGNLRLSEHTLLRIRINYNHQERTIIYEPISLAHRTGELFDEERVNKFLEDDWTMEEIEELQNTLTTDFHDAENIERLLLQYGITREDITEYQIYILYDVVMRTWIDTHGGNYEDERRKIENMNLIDNTFAFAR